MKRKTHPNQKTNKRPNPSVVVASPPRGEVRHIVTGCPSSIGATTEECGRLLSPEERRRGARFVLLAALSPTLLTGIVVARDTQSVKA